ncbi:glycosyltransferase family 4 protein [Pseudophaeobacter sp. TrK17]|uniref:glycosyltransferase family 4 protein n=1 Tax=Pseudophaeobacter sp. TrK17 TaxID=2815167 RepID=UPI0035D0EDAA
MRVLLVTPGVLPVPPVEGGAVETLVQQLVDSLEVSLLDDIDLTVFSIKSPKYNTEHLNFKKTQYKLFNYTPLKRFISGGLGRLFHKFGISRAYFNLYLRAAASLLKRELFDVVVVQNQPEFILPLRKKTKAKIILHLHNDKLNAAAPFSTSIAQGCDGVIAVSNYIKKRVETVTCIDSRNVKSLLNCVDIDRFSTVKTPNTSTDLRQRYGIAPSSKVILFVGRLDPTKGVLELIQAFNTLKQEDLCLLIVGSSWFSSNTPNLYATKLEAEAAEATNQVIFTGFVPHQEVSKFHNLADIVVVPSIWEDPCPLVVLEGMAAGSPVVATDSGGIPELLSEGCGIIVPRKGSSVDFPTRLGKALNDLLVDEGQRKAFALNARNRAEMFGVNDFARRFFETLQDLHDD